MEQGIIKYSNLEELSKSSYQLTSGEADITGWRVKNENGDLIGKVRDLLFDPEPKAIRYIIVDLEATDALLDKAILIPIGLANLAENEDVVIIPDLHYDQLQAMPQYIIGEVTQDTENRIRDIIGSPAALRMEDTIVEIDRANFYRHHHFDKSDFLQRTNRSNDLDVNDRSTER